jgi:hypothetical protein
MRVLRRFGWDAIPTSERAAAEVPLRQQAPSAIIRDAGQRRK